MKNKYNIICFGFLPWSNMWKRNQSMMAELAKHEFINRVIFVNPILSVLSLLRIKNRMLNSTSSIKSKFMPTKFSPNIFVFTPKNIIPSRKYLALLKTIETRIIARISFKIIRRLNCDKPYILFMNCPNAFSRDLIDNLLKGVRLSIFDFSDDFLELGYGKNTLELFKSNIEIYASTANIVLTVNKHISEKYGYLNSNIHVIRNATNYNNFDREHYKSIGIFEKLKSNGKPIIGYCGIANTNRIDTDIVDFLLKNRRNWQFVFIGKASSTILKKYLPNQNFFYIPPVDYISLPDYLQYFDVAIIPFKINEHTMGNDLLKLHDFLAMGKAVVSTEIGGAADLKDVIKIAKNPSEFLDAIEKELDSENKKVFLKRKKCALKNSWPKRIMEFKKLLLNYV
jgi:hypothetical protein